MAVLVALMPIACGMDSLTLGRRTLDAYSANVRLCGFPSSQLVEDPVGGRIGRLHVGQRLPLQLRGDTDRIQTVSWTVDHPPAPQEPPVVRLTQTGRFTAVLEAVAAGGEGPRNYVFVWAEIVFKDGSEGGSSPSFCPGEGRVPADRIIVVP